MLCLGHVTHKYHEVIHIDDEETLMHFIGKHVIYHLLEHARAVAHSKEHHDRFIRSDECDEGSFPLVTTFDAHIVVTPTEVHLSVHVTPFELIDQLRDKRQRVIIADGAIIQILIISHHALLSI